MALLPLFGVSLCTGPRTQYSDTQIQWVELLQVWLRWSAKGSFAEQMNSVHTAWKNPAPEWPSLHQQEAGTLLHSVMLISNHWGVATQLGVQAEFFTSLANHKMRLAKEMDRDQHM